MLWYYLSDTHERIAVSDAQLVPLAARGVLRPATPMWRKGLADWTPCGELKPEIFAAAVIRDSDERNPVTDNVAVRGTVIGLSRTLAGYGPWLRITAVALLAAAILILAGIGWQSWLLIDGRAADIHRWLPFRGELDQRGILDWAVCGVIAFEAVSAVIAVWMGSLLVRSAAGAKRAANTGGETDLHGSMRNAGRSLAIAIVWATILIVTALSASLWLGWEKAFPAAPPRAEDVITI